MYTVKKILNNNGIIVHSNQNDEFIILFKGIGFQYKVDDTLKILPEYKIYAFQGSDDIEKIDPVYIEISAQILEEAKTRCHEIDTSVLMPLADHIAFALDRIKNGVSIENPFSHDIPMLFKEEYSVGLFAKQLILDKIGIEINDDEVGYITLHIHNALTKNSVSESIQMAFIIKDTLKMIESECGFSVNATSTTYNRLLNHMKYMIIRAKRNETLQLNMEQYMQETYPNSYETAKRICEYVEAKIKCELGVTEPGYLAIHIERIKQDSK